MSYRLPADSCQRPLVRPTLSRRPSRNAHVPADEHRTIQVFTREKAIELEVFAVDVVDASSKGKRTDFADAPALDAYLGDKLSRCEVVLERPANVIQAWPL